MGQDQETDMNKLMARYTPAVVISLAISESIAIFGLVLFILGDDFQTLYIFLVVSAIAMIFHRPKNEELRQLSSSPTDFTTMGD